MSETLYNDRINGKITATEDASGWYLLNAADVFVPASAMDAIRKALADAEPLRAAQQKRSDAAEAGRRLVPVVWSVVRGDSYCARAVEPGLLGIDVPQEILDWAEPHGLSSADPDVYLLVTPEDESGEVHGEIAYRAGQLPAANVEIIRDALGV